MKSEIRLVLSAVAIAAFGALGMGLRAQSIERDAVTVPVTFQVRYEISDNTEASPWFQIPIDPSVSLIGGDGPEGWNEADRKTAQLRPGKDYIFPITKTEEVGIIRLQIDAPAGYLVYIDDQRRTRKDFDYGNIKVRIEAEAAVSFGQGSSLRPGRVVWTVGVGNLSNGRAAGEIALRELDLGSSAYTPAALSYDNASEEVERIQPSGVLRQVSAVNGLVDIQAVNAYSFLVRFFRRGQVGLKTDGIVYDVSGKPLYEYLVENPVHPTTGSKIRLTKTVWQGANDASLVTWTEMTKLTSGTYEVVDWVEKPNGATSVSGPIVRTTSNSGNSTTTATKGGVSAPVVHSETRSYTAYSWGSELTQISKGGRSEGFLYADTRMSRRWATDLESTYFSYYSDFDRSGQIYRTFKPFASTYADPNSPAQGEVTTTDFEADWTGRKILPKLIETRINNFVTAKAEITYSSATVIDSSRTYATTPASAMPLEIATRKDYYDAANFLTTTTKSYRSDADPAYRFFPGLPFSVERPDGTMTMHFYYRGTFSTTARTFAVSTNGPETLRLSVSGTVDTTAAAALSAFMLDGATSSALPQSLPAGHVFYVVPGRSTAQATALAADGTIIASMDYICTGSPENVAWQIVRRDVNFYVDSFFLERTSRDSGNVAATWDVATNTWLKGRLESTTDENGIRTEFTYDNVGRVQTKTRIGGSMGSAVVPTLVTTFAYDAAGNVLSEAVSSSGTTETLVTTRTFDLGGRLTSETTAGYPTAGSGTASSVVTSRVYQDSSRMVTTTLPTGGTRIETRYHDGRLQSITGTGAVHEHFSYAAESDGRIKKTARFATSGNDRKRETWTDWLGRTVKTSRPGFTGQIASEETNVYDDTTGQSTKSGRLGKTTKTGVAATLLKYNSLSQVIRSVLDVDGNEVIGEASQDRIVDSGEFFESFDGAWWKTKTTGNYPFAGNATAKEAGKSRQRLTGLTSTLRGETRTYDSEENETRVVVTVSVTDKLVTTTTKRPGMVNDQVEKTLYGLPVETVTHDGLVFKKRYDALGRLSGEIEPRTGSEANHSTKYTYHPNTTWVKETKDAANKRLVFTHYDGAGRPIYTEDGLGKTTRTAYTARGEVEYVWGSATYPVSYVYNDYGERIKLRTYRDPAGAGINDTTSFPSLGAYDETTWEFDAPSGLLKKKTDAKGKFVEYTYNARGQTLERHWSRTLPNSTVRVKATFAYFGDNTGDPKTGELQSVTYNDGTPSVTYTYTRSGQTDAIEDVTGTRDFVYDTAAPQSTAKPWRLMSEALDSFYGSRSLSPIYETAISTSAGALASHTLATVTGRAAGVRLGAGTTPAADLAFTYPISNTGRVAGVSSARANETVSRTFSYGYLANSALVSSLAITGNHPFTITRGYDTNRDLVESVEAMWSTASRTKYTYAYDDRRQRQSVVQTGDVFNDYGQHNGGGAGGIHQIFAYNGRGELTAAATYLGETAADQTHPLSARKHEFDYDGIGNRKWSNTSGTESLRDHYTVNELNQYTVRDNKTLAVGGTVAADANIKVAAGDTAGALAGRKGRHWGDNVVLENSVAPFRGPLRIHALNPTTNKKTSETRTAFIPPVAQAMVYDADGNIVDDGVWTYEWDAENRLKAMQPTANAVMGGVSAQRIEFSYDYMHRRVEKRVLSGVGYGTLDAKSRYLYDGWSMIAEFTVSGSTLTLKRSYTWGLDIAKSLTDAGGVGALVQIRDHSLGKDYLPSYDGNGNIVALFDADSGSSGTCVAAYEYSPYGEFLRCEGTYAKENPFRFSTKFTDDETGLVYYGRRYYDPSNGRFVGRDPKMEAGGLNLYGFVRNNAINHWDYLGMETDGETRYYQGVLMVWRDDGPYGPGWYADDPGSGGSEGGFEFFSNLGFDPSAGAAPATGGGGGGAARNIDEANMRLDVDKRSLSDAAFMDKYGYPKSANLNFNAQFSKQAGPNSCISAAFSLVASRITGKPVSEATFRDLWAKSAGGDADIASGASGIATISYAIAANSILSGYVNTTTSTAADLSSIVSGMGLTDLAIVPIRTPGMGDDWHTVVVQKSPLSGYFTVFDPALGIPYTVPVKDIQPFFDNFGADAAKPPVLIGSPPKK